MSPHVPDSYARNDNFIRKRTHSESEGLSQQAFLQTQLQNAAEGFSFSYGQESAQQPYSYNQPQQQAPTADMSYKSTTQNYLPTVNGAVMNNQAGQLVKPIAESLADTTSPWKDRLIDE